MMKWFIQIFILITLLVACDDSTNIGDGNVKTLDIKSIAKYKNDANQDILIYKKEFNRNGKIISFEEYSDEGKLRSKSRYEHSSMGFSQNKEIFGEDGSVKIINIDYTTREDGKVLGFTEYDGLGQENSTISFDYDDDGNLVGIKKCVEEAKIISDRIENIANSMLSDCDSNEFLSYEYSSDGQVQNVYAVSKSGGFLWRDSIVYLENSSIKKINLDMNGNARYSTNFAYNLQGELQDEYKFSASGELLSSFRYDYTYYY